MLPLALTRESVGLCYVSAVRVKKVARPVERLGAEQAQYVRSAMVHGCVRRTRFLSRLPLVFVASSICGSCLALVLSLCFDQGVVGPFPGIPVRCRGCLLVH